MRALIAAWLTVCSAIGLSGQQPVVARRAPRSGSGTELPLVADRHVRFRTDEGTWMSVDASPDGKSIVFDLLGDLYVMPIEGGHARRITSGAAWDCQPRFSLDGRRIAFVSDRSGADNIWVMDRDGRRARRISNEVSKQPSSPVWQADGKAVVARLVDRGYEALHRTGMSLRRYPVDGLPSESILNPDSAVVLSGASLDPLGRVLYVGAASLSTPNIAPSSYTLLRKDLRSGGVTQVNGAPSNAERPVVSPDGRLLAYAVREVDRTALHTLDLASITDHLVIAEITRDDPWIAADDVVPGFAFTPDSRSIVYTADGKIRRVGLETGRSQVIPFAADVDQRLAPLLRTTHRVEPDSITVRQFLGQTLQSDAGRNQHRVFSAVGRIWSIGKPGSSPIALTTRTGPAGFAFDPAISPDGRWVAYVTAPDSIGGHLWKVPIEGGRARQLDTEPGLYYAPQWSKDGRAILVTRHDRPTSIDPATVASENIWGPPSLYWIDSVGGILRPAMTHPAGDTTIDGFARAIVSGGPDGLTLYAWYARTALVRRGSPYERPASVLEIHAIGQAGTRDRTVWRLVAASCETQPPGRGFVLSPDRRWALVQYRSDAYLIPAAPLRALFDARAVGSVGTVHEDDLDAGIEGSVRLSLDGARDLQWLDNGRVIGWGWASQFTQVPLADVLAAPSERGRWHVRTVSARLRVARPRPAGSLLLRGAHVVTMDGDRDLLRGDILVVRDRIAAVGPTGTVRVPPGTDTIDLTGTTVSPGLIDTHYHAHQWMVTAYQCVEYLRLLARGVTTQRNPNSVPSAFAEGDDIEATASPAPRLFNTGPALMPIDVPISSLNDARRAVRRLRREGAFAIKQYMQPTRIQRQWLRIAVGEAGLNATNEGGADFKLQMTQVIDGYTGIEHTLPPRRLYRDVVELLARSGTVYTPTIGTSMSDHAYWNRLLRTGQEPRLARIPEAGGDDATDVPVDSSFIDVARGAAAIMREGGRVSVGAHGRADNTHLEMWDYALGGMPPLAILRTGTMEGAAAIGVGADLGSITPHKLADLVVYNSDPTHDIRNSRDIRFVMKGGVLYDAHTLKELWPVVRTLPRASVRLATPLDLN